MDGNTVTLKSEDSISDDSIDLEVKIEKNVNNKAVLVEGGNLSQNIAYEYFRQ